MDTKQYPELVAVGHLCMDRVYLVEKFPEENGTTHILQVSQHPGGTASQAAMAFRKLGGSAGYMSPLGDDEIGTTLYEGFRDAGMELSQCRIYPGVTSHYTNVVVSQVKNTRTFMSYHGKFPPMAFDEAQRDYLAHAKILHLDNTQKENALNAARAAKELGVTVSLDGSSMNKDNSKNWELASMADILIVSETYPSRLTGIADRREALLEMNRKLHPKILISTGGGTGCIAVRDGKLVDYPAYKIHPVDTTGAGDAFHGAFLFGYLRGYEFDENIRFASAVGALNCMAMGGRDGLPTLDMVRDFMNTHPFGEKA